jgi:hypothetical protein
MNFFLPVVSRWPAYFIIRRDGVILRVKSRDELEKWDDLQRRGEPNAADGMEWASEMVCRVCRWT